MSEWVQDMLPFKMPEEERADLARWCYEAAMDEIDERALAEELRRDEIEYDLGRDDDDAS